MEDSYLELSSELAHQWLEIEYLKDDGVGDLKDESRPLNIVHPNGDIGYSDEAQERFNDLIDIVQGTIEYYFKHLHKSQ